MLLKLYCSLFSAIAVGTFDWPMIDILQNKDEQFEWTVPTGKYSVKVHSGKDSIHSI